MAENTAAYKQEVQDIINETVQKAKEAGNTLVAEAGNMAWNNDLSMWQDQAVNDCVRRLAQSGLRSIDYASGRAYQMDTAARMCIRTGLSQLSGRITEANLAQTGRDLVITSQQAGSRPEHVPWQNRVFSYSGKNKKYRIFSVKPVMEQ